MAKLKLRQDLGGSGGGASKGGASSGVSAVEANDTLASQQIVQFKDVLCEGEIEGFSTPGFPLRDVFLDGTPVENPDPIAVASLTKVSGNPVATTSSSAINESHVGRAIIGTGIPANNQIIKIELGSPKKLTLAKKPTITGTHPATIGGQLNFENFQFFFVTGTQDQAYLPGFDAEENSASIGVRLRHGTASSDGTSAAWVHTVTNPEADAVRFDVRFPQLQTQVTSGDHIGDLNGASVRIKIQVETVPGTWLTKIDDTIDGKASQPYVRTYKVELAGLTTPQTFRIVRVTPDSTSQALRNDTYIDAVTEVIYGKLSHPNTAMVGAIINAQQFGSIPTRGYRVKGRKVLIPANYTPYDPLTNTPAVYATSGTGTSGGLWDGTFKTGWTSNPAWAWYDMAVNNRFGLGNYLSAANLDKWTLYAISQYNDVMVSNGFGGTEPRFWCGLYIQSRAEALRVMTDMASMFRAVMLFASGLIIPIQDKATAPTMMFSPANVIDGRFHYGGSSRRARHTVVLVTWNDQSDGGIAKPEYVESDQATIAKYGIVQKEITGIGCISRGVAHRMGRYILAAEKS